jgi:hypothetical protein
MKVTNYVLSPTDGGRNMVGNYGELLTRMLFRGRSNGHSSPDADVWTFRSWPELYIDSKMRRNKDALAYAVPQLTTYAASIGRQYLYSSWSWAASTPATKGATVKNQRPTVQGGRLTTVDLFRFMEQRVNALYIVAPEILAALMDEGPGLAIPGLWWPVRTHYLGFGWDSKSLTVPRGVLRALVANPTLLKRIGLAPRSFFLHRERVDFTYAIEFSDSIVAPEEFRMNFEIHYLASRTWGNRVRQLVRSGVAYRRSEARKLMRQSLALFDQADRQPVYMPF